MIQPFDQIEPSLNPKSTKMPLGKVVLANFTLMLSYMMFFWNSIDQRDPYSGLEDLVMCALFLAAQVVLNLIVGLVLVSNTKYKHLGTAMLLGGVITALVGFGTCIATQDYFWRL